MFDKCCDNCEFLMYDGSSSGLVCAGSSKYYGKNVEPDFVCNDWEASFEAYQNGDIPDDALFN